MHQEHVGERTDAWHLVIRTATEEADVVGAERASKLAKLDLLLPASDDDNLDPTKTADPRRRTNGRAQPLERSKISCVDDIEAPVEPELPRQGFIPLARTEHRFVCPVVDDVDFMGRHITIDKESLEARRQDSNGACLPVDRTTPL